MLHLLTWEVSIKQLRFEIEYREDEKCWWSPPTIQRCVALYRRVIIAHIQNDINHEDNIQMFSTLALRLQDKGKSDCTMISMIILFCWGRSALQKCTELYLLYGCRSLAYCYGKQSMLPFDKFESLLGKKNNIDGMCRWIGSMIGVLRKWIYIMAQCIRVFVRSYKRFYDF